MPISGASRARPKEPGFRTMAVDPSNVTALSGGDASRLKVAGAIKQAANATGTSFEYLLATAKMESDFNPSAGASTLATAPTIGVLDLPTPSSLRANWTSTDGALWVPSLDPRWDGS